VETPDLGPNSVFLYTLTQELDDLPELTCRLLVVAFKERRARNRFENIRGSYQKVQNAAGVRHLSRELGDSYHYVGAISNRATYWSGETAQTLEDLVTAHFLPDALNEQERDLLTSTWERTKKAQSQIDKGGELARSCALGLVTNWEGTLEELTEAVTLATSPLIELS
jgi:hypothetical protein